MTSKLPRIAVDSCVLLDFLTGMEPDRAERARVILDGHGERHLVVLPAIVIAEIAGAPIVRGGDLPKDTREERIRRVMQWIERSRFLVAELSERTARRAAQLAPDLHLKGQDASVLATALEWSCAVLYTRDKQLLKQQFDGLLIKEPELPPPPVWQLFDSVGAPTREGVAVPALTGE